MMKANVQPTYEGDKMAHDLSHNPDILPDKPLISDTFKVHLENLKYFLRKQVVRC